MPFFRNYLINIQSRVVVISLDGWRIGQRNLHRSSCLFSAVPTKFHLRQRQFLYEFCVKKLVFWGFRGYLGEIELKNKRGQKFHVRFFSHNQWCVRVSASNVCSPICSASRDTTLGSFLPGTRYVLWVAQLVNTTIVYLLYQVYCVDNGGEQSIDKHCRRQQIVEGVYRQALLATIDYGRCPSIDTTQRVSENQIKSALESLRLQLSQAQVKVAKDPQKRRKTKPENKTENQRTGLEFWGETKMEY